MLICDKKTLHSIQAMLTIASHTGSQPIAGKEIAAIHDLPARYLEQMLQRLVRGELLRGVRGPRGGYVLAREKRRISLAHILEAIQTEEDLDNIDESKLSNLELILKGLQEDAYKKLEAITLQDLVPANSNDANEINHFAI